MLAPAAPRPLLGRAVEVCSSQRTCLLCGRPGRLGLTQFGALLLDACVLGVPTCSRRVGPSVAREWLLALRSGLSAGSGAPATSLSTAWGSLPSLPTAGVLSTGIAGSWGFGGWGKLLVL